MNSNICSNTYFSVNGDKKKLNFAPLATIWLKDQHDNIYETYIFYYKEGKDYPFYFETPNEDSTVENFSFSFETEEDCIQSLCKHYFPKLSEDGPVVQEGVHTYSSGDDFYTYDKTLYPNAVLVNLDEINVTTHKYSRELDDKTIYKCLPPIKLKISFNKDFSYEIRDGFHRTKYSKEKGHTKIPAIIS
jgi:hypothetical protein